MPIRSTDIDIELSIVMPCLNEAETLLDCIKEAQSAIKTEKISAEIIVADNGSTDGSQEIARGTLAKVINVEDKGYGNALIGGIISAKGKYVLLGDADGSYDFGELASFLHMLRKGNDLVMGCRLPRGGGKILPNAMPRLHRWIGNPILSLLGKLFFNAPVDDFHCGLRAFDRKAISDLKLQCSGMEFASEMVVKAALNDLKIEQIPITLRPDGRSRKPHLRSWSDGWRHLRFMLLLAPNWLFLFPGITIFITSLVGFIRLLDGPFIIGKISFDTNTLLVCATGLQVGIQTIFLAIFIKTLAYKQKLQQPVGFTKIIMKSATIEWGLVIGLVVSLIGLINIVGSTIEWKNAGFGALSYSEGLRSVIPAVTFLAIGINTMFFGFALAVIKLENRQN